MLGFTFLICDVQLLVSPQEEISGAEPQGCLEVDGTEREKGTRCIVVKGRSGDMGL